MGVTVICNMKECIHRSKRPLRKWHMLDGSPCYSCNSDQIFINQPYDPDGEIYALTGEIFAKCNRFTPIEEESDEDE